MAASAPSAVALSVTPPDALLALPEELELLDEPELPDEPELDEVEADDAAVDELESPLLSAVVWDAVSHAAMKKATAVSAIRRCNMVMLPVFQSGHPVIRLDECFHVLGDQTGCSGRLILSWKVPTRNH
jgi:hypothetical protein